MPKVPLTGEQVIVDRIEKYLARETGIIVFLVGPPGSGKSYSALRLATRIDPLFGIANVCFTVEEYLSVINRGTTVGEAVVLDEAGVMGPSRKWQSASNIALALTAESVRHRGLLTLVTVPSASMVDAIVRKLAVMLLTCQGVDHRKQAVRVRPYTLTTDEFTGQEYRHFITVWRAGMDRPVALEQAMVYRPPAELVDAYMAKRKAHMDELYRAMESDLSGDPDPDPVPKGPRKRDTEGRFV